MRRLVFRTIIVGLMAFMLSLDVVLAQSNTRSSGSNNNTTTIDVLQLLKNAAEKSEARKKQSDEKKNTGKNSKKDRSSSSSMNETRDAFLNDREKRNTTTSTKKTDNTNPTISSAKATTAQTNNQKAADDITLVVDGEGKDKTEATKNALRSAIEQSYGTFVSANTVILNDELVKDEIATVSSGNIKSYKELSSTTLQNGNSSVTLSATVSIGKLISYAQSKGASAEFAGQAFMMNERIRELNKINEQKALLNLLFKLDKEYSSFWDFSVKIEDAKKSDNGWDLPFSIEAKANQNYIAFFKELKSTLEALQLSETDLNDYRAHNISTNSLIFTFDDLCLGLAEYDFSSPFNPRVDWRNPHPVNVWLRSDFGEPFHRVICYYLNPWRCFYVSLKADKTYIYSPRFDENSYYYENSNFDNAGLILEGEKFSTKQGRLSHLRSGGAQSFHLFLPGSFIEKVTGIEVKTYQEVGAMTDIDKNGDLFKSFSGRTGNLQDFHFSHLCSKKNDEEWSEWKPYRGEFILSIGTGTFFLISEKTGSDSFYGQLFTPNYWSRSSYGILNCTWKDSNGDKNLVYSSGMHHNYNYLRFRQIDGQRNQIIYGWDATGDWGLVTHRRGLMLE